MFHIERNALHSNRTNEHEHDMNRTNGKSYTIFTHNVLRRVCYANTGRLLYFEQARTPNINRYLASHFNFIHDIVGEYELLSPLCFVQIRFACRMCAR